MIINLQMKEKSPTVIAGIMLKIENNSFLSKQYCVQATGFWATT